MARANRVVTYFAVPAGAARGTSGRVAELSRATSAFARARRLVVIEPFVELRSGRARPELQRAIERCRETRAALLVPGLAALGGDLAFLDALLDSGVALFAADAGAVRRPTLRLLRNVARHAQSTASDRSRDALRAARRRGVKLGSPRPEIGSRAGVAALRARANAHAEALAPALRELLLSNPTASLRDLAAILEELELPTPRRGRWGPSGVRNALRRAGLAVR
jgi:Resolvase, N terminal domain